MKNTNVSKPSRKEEELIKDLKIILKLEDIKATLEIYDYTIKDNYLCSVIYKNGAAKYQKLSNFIAVVTKEILKDDGSSEKLDSYIIHGLNLFTNKPLPVISVPLESFSSGNWIQKYWGMKAIIEPGLQNKEKVKHSIQLLSQESKTQTLYTHFGWRKIDEKWAYLHAGGAIGSRNIDVQLENNDLDNYLLKESDISIEKSANFSLKFLKLADESVTYPLLSLISLTPLCEIFNQSGIIPKFTMYKC